MRRLLIAALVLAMTLGSALAEDYRGIWVGDGVAVEIWREDSALQCRAVFTEGDVAESWDYGACYEHNDGLECFGITRTRERLDDIWNVLEELSWSMNDICFAGFEPSEDGLTFTNEEMDAPLTLTRLDDTAKDPRSRALAFVGRWVGEDVSVRVEDHGVACLFTVTVPVEADVDWRWTYTCRYDPDIGRMDSVNVSPRKVITREANGDITEIEEDIYAEFRNRKKAAQAKKQAEGLQIGVHTAISTRATYTKGNTRSLDLGNEQKLAIMQMLRDD